VRPLTNNDLGILGNIEDIQGTFSIKDKTAIVKINLIQGEIKNPFKIINNLQIKAIESGSNSLKIEATIVNEKLYNILTRRYGLKTLGGVDTIDILL
jgi:acetolactate synthase small subunit